MQNLNKRTKVKMDARLLRDILFGIGLRQIDVAKQTDLCTVIINKACNNRTISLKSAKSILKAVGYGWDEAVKNKLVIIL